MMERSDLWRVVTLNIWNRQGPWPERLPLIRDGLRALDADAISLQEVLAFGGATQAHEIAEGLGWNVYYAPAWEIGGGLTFGNAILSPHRLVDTQCLPLPTPAGLETRSCAFARIECAHGPMPFFATHLTFQAHLGHVRCAQVRALADHVASTRAYRRSAAGPRGRLQRGPGCRRDAVSARSDPARRRRGLLRRCVARLWV